MFFAILMVALQAQRAPARMGKESLLGRTGSARSAISPIGTVQLGGELWTSELADGQGPIPKGSQVEVIEVKGVRVIVRQVQQ
jgi:membrane-bound ClpP family serine protease